MSADNLNTSYINFKLAEKRKNESYTKYYLEYLERWSSWVDIFENIFLAFLIVLFVKNIYQYRKFQRANRPLIGLFLFFVFSYIYVKKNYITFKH